MSGHVWFKELYERTHREHQALVSLAQDRGRWKRVTQWAARAAAPPEFYVRVKQHTKLHQAALWFGVKPPGNGERVLIPGY
eukprot:9608059-Alexandrium_andersonii.AAC.1